MGGGGGGGRGGGGGGAVHQFFGVTGSATTRRKTYSAPLRRSNYATTSKFAEDVDVPVIKTGKGGSVARNHLGKFK